MKNLIVRFDTNTTIYVQNLPYINGLMNGITTLGDPVIIGVIALSAMTYGWLKNMQFLTNAFAVALLACVGSEILKLFIHRTRPDTVYVTAMKFKSYSFPSGHAFSSLVIYGLLAYLAYQHLSAPWNIVVPAILLVAIILVGISRVYLGAHYPTDVLGGWLLGLVTLFLIIKYLLK